MNQVLRVITLWLLGALCFNATQANAAAPRFSEVYQLIQKNLPGSSEDEMDQAALKGLVSALAPRVSLILPPSDSANNTVSTLVTRSNLFDNSIAFLRIGSVAQGLQNDFGREFNALATKAKPTGIILDLRYAGGTDYGAAARFVELFTREKQPIMDWGAGTYSSQHKTNAVDAPLVVLVNSKTEGAAEALAAALRDVAGGLILGNTTAGRAFRYAEYKLQSGDVLRIAQGPVLSGKGKEFPSSGIKPDITVALSDSDELAWFSDPYYSGPTNSAATVFTGARRGAMNEAELVRERRGDTENPAVARKPPTVAAQRQVQDPTLSRALDLLKGIALMRQTKS